MRLESARELKALCLKQQVNPIVARAAAASALAISARSVSVVDDVQRTIALGIIPKGKNSYQLGVRVQTRALENGPQVEAIRKQAKGEVEVRYVGRIVKRAAPWYRIRQQPLLIGTSIGHFSITAGTLGCFVAKGEKSSRESSPIITFWPRKTTRRKATQSCNRDNSTKGRRDPTRPAPSTVSSA